MVVAALGYYFYSTRQSLRADLPDPVAWRAVTHSASGAITWVEVVALEGDKWRLEAKNPSRPKILVAIHDGSTFTSSFPGISKALNPKPMLELLISATRGQPEAVEQIGERRYLRFSEKLGGNLVCSWIDAETKFPYRVDTLEGESIYYSLLPVDFLRERSVLFDISSLAPRFADSLGKR